MATTNLRDKKATTDDEPVDDHITGPYLGFDRFGNPEYTFFVCEACGDESIRRADLEHGCTEGA